MALTDAERALQRAKLSFLSGGGSSVSPPPLTDQYPTLGRHVDPHLRFLPDRGINVASPTGVVQRISPYLHDTAARTEAGARGPLLDADGPRGGATGPPVPPRRSSELVPASTTHPAFQSSVQQPSTLEISSLETTRVTGGGGGERLPAAAGRLGAMDATALSGVSALLSNTALMMHGSSSALPSAASIGMQARPQAQPPTSLMGGVGMAARPVPGILKQADANTAKGSVSEPQPAVSVASYQPPLPDAISAAKKAFLSVHAFDAKGRVVGSAAAMAASFVSPKLISVRRLRMEVEFLTMQLLVARPDLRRACADLFVGHIPTHLEISDEQFALFATGRGDKRYATSNGHDDDTHHAVDVSPATDYAATPYRDGEPQRHDPQQQPDDRSPGDTSTGSSGGGSTTRSWDGSEVDWLGWTPSLPAPPVDMLAFEQRERECQRDADRIRDKRSETNGVVHGLAALNRNHLEAMAKSRRRELKKNKKSNHVGPDGDTTAAAAGERPELRRAGRGALNKDEPETLESLQAQVMLVYILQACEVLEKKAAEAKRADASTGADIPSNNHNTTSTSVGDIGGTNSSSQLTGSVRGGLLALSVQQVQNSVRSEGVVRGSDSSAFSPLGYDASRNPQARGAGRPRSLSAASSKTSSRMLGGAAAVPPPAFVTGEPQPTFTLPAAANNAPPAAGNPMTAPSSGVAGVGSRTVTPVFHGAGGSRPPSRGPAAANNESSDTDGNSRTNYGFATRGNVRFEDSVAAHSTAAAPSGNDTTMLGTEATASPNATAAGDVSASSVDPQQQRPPLTAAPDDAPHIPQSPIESDAETAGNRRGKRAKKKPAKTGGGIFACFRPAEESDDEER